MQSMEFYLTKALSSTRHKHMFSYKNLHLPTLPTGSIDSNGAVCWVQMGWCLPFCHVYLTEGQLS